MKLNNAKKSTKTGKNFGGKNFSGWPEYIPLREELAKEVTLRRGKAKRVGYSST